MNGDNQKISDQKAQPYGSSLGRVMARVAAASFVLLVFLSIVSSVIGLGSTLSESHAVFGALYYIAICILISAGVVYPIACVVLRPVDTLSGLRTARGTDNKRNCRSFAKSMIASGILSEEQCCEIRQLLTEEEGLADGLSDYFKQYFVPRINQAIKANAKTAFFTSAIVRSPLVEAVTMLSVNLNLVRAIVEVCGFRPSNVAMFKLYARVMLSALMASGLEEMDLDSMFAGLMGGAATSHVTGAVMASATQGMVSAFLVYRVGVMTRDILCSETPVASMGSLRAQSYAEALSMMRESGFIGEVLDTVRAKAAQATSAAASKVKNAASQAGRSARDVFAGAVTTVGSAVGAAMGNAVKRVNSD